MSDPVKNFLVAVSQLAAKLGAPVLVFVRDPATRAVECVGTPKALDNMRVEIMQKAAPPDEQNVGVTGWD